MSYEFSKPILLAAYSNDNACALGLRKEHELLRNLFSNSHSKLEYDDLLFTELANLIDQLNRNNQRIHIFHFAGHSDSEKLHIVGGYLHSDNLSCLLEQQVNLRLVFLNACANKGIVKVLLDRGVKAVIATSKEIDDEQAVTVAERFYKSLIVERKKIRDAFKDAMVINNEKFKHQIDFRGIRLRQEERDSIEFPWGLYFRNEAHLDWCVQEVEERPILEQLRVLRKASMERYQRFTGKGGRFHHLNIKDAILTGIEDLKQKNEESIKNDISVEGEIQPLIQCLPQLWNSECPHALLVGTAGMGKTVSLIRLWELWSKTEATSFPIPIFIQLNEFNNRPEKDFIRNYIQKHFADVDFDELIIKPNLTKEVRKRPHLILLLDGFNEVTTQKKELLQEINRLKVHEDYAGVQLVLTSRVDVLSTYQWQVFHLLELQPLAEMQISAYLDQALPSNPRQLALLHNPMMLSIYAAQCELPQIFHDKGTLKKEVKSSGELLYNVEAIQRIKMEEQYATDPPEQINRRFILEHVLPIIGWEMQQAGTFYIEEEEKEHTPGLFSLMNKVTMEILNTDFFRVFKDFRKMDKNFFQGKEDWELIEEWIDQVCCEDFVLLVKENEEYRFLHQNFRDYFAARYVQNQIQIALRKKALPYVLRKAPLDFYIRQLLGELEAEHTNEMEWNEEKKKWQWTKGQFFLKNHLTQLLEQCRVNWGQDQLGYTLWNLLTIWKEHRGEWSGANLCKLNFNNYSFNGQTSGRHCLTARFSGSKLNGKNLFFQGHSNSYNNISSAEFSPDGKHIMSSGDHVTKVWNINSGSCLFTFSHKEYAYFYPPIFSPDGQNIMTYDDHIKIWNTTTGSCLFTVNDDEYAIFSPDGRRILTSNKKEVWDTKTGQYLFTLDCYSEEEKSSIEGFSPNGQYILTSESKLAAARIFDAKTGQNLMTFPGYSLRDHRATFSHSSQYIAITGWLSNHVVLWNVESGSHYRTLELGLDDHYSGLNDNSLYSDATITRGEIGQAEFSSDDRYLLTTYPGNAVVKVWEVETGKCLLSINGSVTFCPDGSNILVKESNDTIARIWNLETDQLMVSLEKDLGEVGSIAFSPDGQRVFITSGQTIKVWDTKTGRCLFDWKENYRHTKIIDLSLDGRYLLTLSSRVIVEVWDTETGAIIQVVEHLSTKLTNAVFSSSGHYVLTSSEDNLLRIWDVKTGICIMILECNSSWVDQAVFSPDRKLILISSDELGMELWDTKTGQYLLTLEESAEERGEVVFCSDGKRIIKKDSTYSYQPDSIVVWDTETGNRLFHWQNNISNVEECSPNGKFVLIGINNQVIQVCNAETGKDLFTLSADRGTIEAGSISPDSERIFILYKYRVVKIWDIVSGHQILEFNTPSDISEIVDYDFNGGRILKSIGDGKLEVWDIEMKECLAAMEDSGVTTHFVKLSPNGQWVVRCLTNERLEVWDVDTGKYQSFLLGFGRMADFVEFSSDGNSIVAGLQDGRLKIWNIETGKECLSILSNREIKIEQYSPYIEKINFEFSPDGKKFATDIEPNTLKVWDLTTELCLFTYENYWGDKMIFEFSPDGKYILLNFLDANIEIWDIKKKERFLMFTPDPNDYLVIEFSPTGQYILEIKAAAITVREIETNEYVFNWEENSNDIESQTEIDFVTFSPDGKKLLVVLNSIVVKVWEIATKECLYTILDHQSPIHFATFSPDGQQIYTNTVDSELKIWNAETGLLVLTIDDHSGTIKSLTVSPSGKYIITDSYEKEVKLYNMDTGENLFVWNYRWVDDSITAISPDGRQILTMKEQDQVIKVTDADTGMILLTLEGQYWVNNVQFSPDGNHILACSDSSDVWSARTGEYLLSLGSGYIDFASYSPDGRYILTQNRQSSKVQLWDAKNGNSLSSLPIISGLFFQGCDFRDLHPDSELSEEEIALLRQYGGIFSDEDKVQWDELMEKFYDF